MAISLDRVVPWGRSFEEYVRMFDLSPADLQRKILGCGDGPASFNAEMHRQGRRVTSLDPIYRFSAKQIAERIAETREVILEQLGASREAYVWDTVGSPEELGELRMSAMQTFLADYPGGRREARYVAGELPALPFADGEFDLALCSHLLFLYSEQLSPAFHQAAVAELLRVAREVRIFPLVTLTGSRSPHLSQVIPLVEAAGGQATVVRVPYEFQRGGDEMLLLRRGGGSGQQAPSRC